MNWFIILWPGVSLLVIGLCVMFAGRYWAWLATIISLVSLSVWISLPNNPGFQIDLNRDGRIDIDKRIEVRQGLDLAGGVKVLLEADVPANEPLPAGVLEETERIIEQRIDSLGTLEPTIQTQGDRRIIVELPGFSDPEAAIDLVAQTALLEFVDFGFTPPPLEGSPVTTTLEIETGQAAAPAPDSAEIVYETIFTGEILSTAEVGTDPTRPGQLLVLFTLTPEGSQQFGAYTEANVGSFLGIVLDGVLVSAPQIQDRIVGQGSISGDFDLESAERLATQLRYGALPVPLRVDSTSTVGPTLGQVSVQQSIRAGIIGIIVVIIFMIVYYRVPGLAAAGALLVFALLNFALYKAVPITLTLPAITGFLIGIGTAVDGNILIFERMKEELRRGRQLERAVEAGFDRAFPSIRDSNISTIIICAILYAFGSTFAAGPVQGFALTLALSLTINLFTAIIVTRTFLHFLMLPITDETIRDKRWLFSL